MFPSHVCYIALFASLALGSLGAEPNAQRVTAIQVGSDLPTSSVVRPPSGLSYAVSPARYAPGIRIPANRASVDGVVKRYSVTPPLPAGVKFDPKTGTISGVAVTFTPPVDYTITARNSAGSSTVVLNLSTDVFGLISTSVVPGSVLELNRSVDFIFNEDVDPSTISLNTLKIATDSGLSAVGTFSFAPNPSGGTAQNVVRFQPDCPLQPDFSDAGFAPGLTYVLDVPDQGFTPLTVRSVSGKALGVGRQASFFTASGTSPSMLFFDPVVGPPTPVVRDVGSRLQQASYLELGGNTPSRVYFEYDPVSMGFVLELPTFEAPRNLYADSASQVGILLQLDQPVAPEASNLERLDVEFLAGNGAWRPMQVRVELLSNCASGGALVRMTPVGPFPHAAQVRVVVQPGFKDLVGQASLLALDDFAVVPTEGILFQSLTPPDDGADELLERFLGGDLEDDAVVFGVARARWGEGELSAAWEISNGGPRGDFDFVLQSGQSYLFDTTSQQVAGGPFGVPSTVVTAVGGVLEVRNFIIQDGASFRVVGPNPLKILASGRVEIRGTLDLSGFPGIDVPNLANAPQAGGQGVAGGGKGGDSSSVVNNSTPRGCRGEGFAQEAGGGGGGGETGYAPKSMGKNHRRAGGGGGGRFGADRVTSFGVLQGEAGFDGHESARGAVTGVAPAPGGEAGARADSDGDADNDHWGVRSIFDSVTGEFSELRKGELAQPLGGSGGGGGGDAVPNGQFPFPNWTPFSDEMGGPGGGGGGQLRIHAVGPILFGSSGHITADGGRGGIAQRFLFLDHTGGSGGGGAGGHVVLETASWIDFTDGAQNDQALAPFGFVSAAGGKGGTGILSWSKGGDGGPGIVQLHVPDATNRATRHPIVGGTSSASIYVPLAASQLTDPLEVTTPPAYSMVPTFGARSKARSKWISLGGAAEVPGASPDPITFRFGGTEKVPGAMQGSVLTSGGVVQREGPLLGPAALGPDAEILPSGFSLALSANELAPWIADTQVPSRDMYLRTPQLLHGLSLRLAESGAPGTFKDFEVTQAYYLEFNGKLYLTVDLSTGFLSTYAQGLANPVYSLIPRAFQVSSGGVVDALPTTSHVRITFEATGADSFGNPDESNVLVNTGDIADFNALVPGAAKFFRFQVEFDLDTVGNGVSAATESVSLDFLRVPFRF